MLYIYSGEVPELNASLLENFGPSPVVTTIPVSPQEMAAAKHTTEHLRQSGVRARLLGARFYRDSHRLRNIVMNSTAIYLMGGNTFEFLAYAQSVGLFNIVAEFEAAGGVIMAESAGSIILSPNIATALIPTTCPDEHTIKLDDYRGMGRIPFHVSPHYEPAIAVAQQELNELQSLANFSNCPVLVLQDGEGVILDGDHIAAQIGQPQMLNPAARGAVAEHEPWLPVWANRLMEF